MAERKRFDGVRRSMIEKKRQPHNVSWERVEMAPASLLEIDVVRPQLEAALEEFEESVAVREATSVVSDSWYRAHDRVEAAKADILYGLWLEVDE